MTDRRVRTYRSASSARRPSKYGNVKCKIDGYTFDSQKEGRRYAELKILMRENKIRDLELQKEYELVPAYRDAVTGKMVRAVYYRADFVYYDIEKQRTVIEDVKGYRTDAYKIKKKLMGSKGLYITEV